MSFGGTGLSPLCPFGDQDSPVGACVYFAVFLVSG